MLFLVDSRQYCYSGMNAAYIDVIYSFLIKNVRFTCVCAFFLVLRGHLPQAGPSSKLQLKNAAHTLATLEIFAKIVTLLRYLSARTIMNKFPLCSVKLPQIDTISILFVNISRFACVCQKKCNFDGTSRKRAPPRNYS